MRKARVGLVIGSGSVKCAASLGVVKVMAEAGIDIDLAVGCSGGAIYATLLALGHDYQESTDMTMELWTRDVMEKKNRRAMLQAAMPKTMRFSTEWGLRKSSSIEERLTKAYGDKTFADTKIPLHLAATDLQTGEQVVLQHGSLVQGIMASSAIPFLFPAVEVEGRLLVDGFVSDPLPVGIAVQEGADVIIALGFESPYQQINSLSRYARQMTAIMSNNLLKSRFAFQSLAHHAEVLPIVPQFTERIGTFSTDKMPHAVECGELAAKAALPRIIDAIEAVESGRL